MKELLYSGSDPTFATEIYESFESFAKKVREPMARAAAAAAVAAAIASTGLVYATEIDAAAGAFHAKFIDPGPSPEPVAIGPTETSSATLDESDPIAALVHGHDAAFAAFREAMLGPSADPEVIALVQRAATAIERWEGVELQDDDSDENVIWESEG